MQGSERIMEGSDSMSGEVKLINCEDHNEPIKDNLKYKIKYNKKNNRKNNSNKNLDGDRIDDMYFEELNEIEGEIESQRLFIDEVTMINEEQIRSSLEVYPDLEECLYKKEFEEDKYLDGFEEGIMDRNPSVDERYQKNDMDETQNKKMNSQRVPRRGLEEIEEEVIMSGFVEELMKGLDDMDDDL